MTATPFVSVLIDTYNQERFIEQAIVSALEQDFPAAEREILVVDDGSTDRTPEIVRKFAPEVRLLRKVNGGQASAFNAGIPECRGEIAAMLDGDDTWVAGKLKRVAQVMAADASIGLVGHGIRECTADGLERTLAPEKSERLRLDSLASAKVFRLRKSYLGTSRMTVRTELARRILPVPEALVFEADEYLFTLAAQASAIVILQEALTCYRIHGGNLYVSAGGGRQGLRRKQEVMQALAGALRKALAVKRVSEEIVACVVEVIQMEADQLRLTLDGGMPWETLRTETGLYGVLHGDATRSHRLFRTATMLPAMLLPPRWFYAARGWLASRRWYKRARQNVLPPPGMTGVAGPGEFKA